jgi:hypothetical protein
MTAIQAGSFLEYKKLVGAAPAPKELVEVARTLV